MKHHDPAEYMPDILITERDEQKLLSFIPVMKDRNTARYLLSELERARVVEDRNLPNTAVRMGSTVTYLINGQSRRTVKVVYPGEADLEQNRLSVLTPVGAALIGMSSGQSTWYEGPDSRPHRLSVLTVIPSDTTN